MMAKKNLARRSLAMIMAMVMCLSLFQITAFASDDTFTYPSVTIVSDGTSAKYPEVTGSNGTSVSGSKILEKTGDNTFNVTLQVKTVSTSATAFTADAAHVVLVIDRSGSMGPGYGNAIKDARAAAKSFANIFLGENASDDNRLAVVSFANGVKTDSVLDGKSKLNDLTCKDGIIDKINAGGGTLTQGGIYTAQQILRAGHVEGVKDIIVLLSDGAPTYSYQLTGTATSDWNGTLSNINITDCDYNNVLGNGDDYEIHNGWNLKLNVTYPNGYTNTKGVDYGVDGLISRDSTSNNGYGAIWEASQAKAASTEIYSVLLTSRISDGNAVATMQGVATDTTTHYLSGNADALAGLFQRIANTVVTPATGTILTDPMSPYVTLGDVTLPATPNAGEIDPAGNQIKWDLSKATPVKTTENGKTVNTYTLTYQITVNRDTDFYAAVKSAGVAGVPTNGPTALNCRLGGVDKTLNFTVPTVTSAMPQVPYKIEYYQQTPPYTPGGDTGDEDGGYKPTTPIPSNPTPLSPTPGTTTNIPEGNVPQTDVPETDIPDEETPLAATPAKTGDNLILWVLAAGVSGIGLVWVSLMGRKRRDEDGSQN